MHALMLQYSTYYMLTLLLDNNNFNWHATLSKFVFINIQQCYRVKANCANITCCYVYIVVNYMGAFNNHACYGVATAN